MTCVRARRDEQVPSKNVDCGAECFFPQRIAEHPFLFDRFGHLKGEHVPSVPLDEKTKELLRHHDWFWVVTGVHRGGGLDCSLVIRKSGPPLGLMPPLSTTSQPLASAALAAGHSCSSGCVEASALRDATRALAAAQQLQAKLQGRMEELTTQLQLAEAEGARASGYLGATAALADAGAPANGQWPLLLVLLASVCANVALWRKRHASRSK